jgi:branched-chain amino acid transport system permease protein
MFAFTRTPLGRMLNAVRDNPERVEFVGYNTQIVRYIAFIAAASLGMSGGLAALNFEIVTSEVVSAPRSGAYLLFTFLGGATLLLRANHRRGADGAGLVLLSELTKAWLLYLGLIFTVHGDVRAGWSGQPDHDEPARGGARQAQTAAGELPGAGMAVFALLALVGAGAMIEMVYHLQLNAAMGDELNFLGLTLNARSAASWIGSAVAAAVGLGLFEWVRRGFSHRWSEVQTTIEARLRAQEAA